MVSWVDAARYVPESIEIIMSFQSGSSIAEARSTPMLPVFLFRLPAIFFSGIDVHRLSQVLRRGL